MSERDRLRALSEAGRTAAAGVRALLTGFDVVIDPNGGDSGPERAAARPPATGPAAAGLPGVGSAIGRRALAAAAHRPGLAERLSPGAALPTRMAQERPETDPALAERGAAAELPARPPPSVACYPCEGTAALCRALGLTGEMLPAHGDLEGPATSRDLAWLPILAGWSHYRSLPGGRLLAVGGYRRAALVRFDHSDGGDGHDAHPADLHPQPVWAALGNDALAALAPVCGRFPLYLEEPERLRAAIAAGQVRQALLGGADLAWAEGLPAARVVRTLSGSDAGLDWVPVWGLFSRGATVTWPEGDVEADPRVVLVPLETAPGLMAWLNRAVTV
ncbi:hypothetical protein J2Z79_002526 [Symbiobacterium terraclitae]|uniref:Uncharacterized protein n=1 Tax=Symbiobacterium terraclitae TaxID=557451 RepID=A0ABS4JU81_9FIRM|nr:hypothetical protein [Symbiobacterium terraclitae]MBP2019109.1 hypothetical protein [Symbiobacterium terraclitae]